MKTKLIITAILLSSLPICSQAAEYRQNVPSINEVKNSLPLCKYGTVKYEDDMMLTCAKQSTFGNRVQVTYTKLSSYPSIVITNYPASGSYGNVSKDESLDFVTHLSFSLQAVFGLSTQVSDEFSSHWRDSWVTTDAGPTWENNWKIDKPSKSNVHKFNNYMLEITYRNEI